MADHTKAKGYKYNHGVIELHDNPLYNFCCDFVYDSAKVKPDVKSDPFSITGQLTSRNSIILIWS